MIAALSVALMAGVAQAEQRPLEISRIVAQQQQIRDDVTAGRGRYKNMPETKREELLTRQRRLLTMLEGKITADDLTQSQQTDAFNTLEWIEATINNSANERVVCSRERTLGSQRVTRSCRSEEQMRIERERARDDMDRSSDHSRR